MLHYFGTWHLGTYIFKLYRNYVFFIFAYYKVGIDVLSFKKENARSFMLGIVTIPLLWCLAAEGCDDEVCWSWNLNQTSWAPSQETAFSKTLCDCLLPDGQAWPRWRLCWSRGSLDRVEEAVWHWSRCRHRWQWPPMNFVAVVGTHVENYCSRKVVDQ